MSTVIDGEVLARYDVTEAKLSEMRTRLIVPDCATKDGYEFARKGIAECRNLRVAIEKRRKDLKADALEWGSKVDSVAKELTSKLEAIEGPLQQAKDAIDEAAERSRREKEEAERKAREEAERKQREEEQRKLAEERAKLDAERAKLEAEQRAERERMEAAARVEREKLEAERRKIEAEQAEIRLQQAEAQAKIDAERAAVEAERRRIELEEAKRVAAEQAVQRERERIERECVEAERRAEQERIAREKAEADRKALLPDVEKLREYHSALIGVEIPKIVQVAAIAPLNAVRLAIKVFGDAISNLGQ